MLGETCAQPTMPPSDAGCNPQYPPDHRYQHKRAGYRIRISGGRCARKGRGASSMSG